MSDLLWIVVAGIAVAAAAIAHFFDRDAGGYVDSFFNHATYPKKGVHAVCGALLTFALARVMPIGYAVPATIIVGAAYEWGQGYFSWLDLVADAAGALAVWLLVFLTYTKPPV